MAVNGIITQEQITQLVESDLVQNRKTLELIDSQREREVQAKTELEEIRSAAADIESALDTLKSADTFYSSTVTSSDTSIVSAEAGANTSLTSYDISNITMAKAAQKVSSSTIGLTDATSAYYESTASIEDATAGTYFNGMDDISGWDKFSDTSHRITSQETFDGKETLNLQINTPWNNHYSYATENIGATTIADQFTAETSIYLDNANTLASNSTFSMEIEKSNLSVKLQFAEDGLYAYDGSAWNEVGTDLVTQGIWQDWKFEVNATDPATATMDVYLGGSLVASAVDVSNTGTFVEGDITYRQNGNTEAGQAHVDSLRVSQTAVSGIVEENRLLDGSEGVTSILGTITDGYFEINDQRITVDTTKDTLMEVLSKINAAENGVTATWDNDNDMIRLTVDEGGVDTIDFGADTSGFFAAMNLDTSAPTDAGIEPAWDRELDQVAALSSVTNGYFNINGITFDVDTSVDSLQDILNDINHSKAGVSAYYEKSLDKVVMTSTETGEKISFDNDTSNFIATIMGDLNEADYVQGSVDVNGQTISIDSNEFEIGDVKFKVHAESTEGATVTISRDTEKATAAIEDFVTKYNDLRTMIDEKTLGGQPLSNDRILRNMENNLRFFVLNPISNTGSYDFLRDIGVQYKRGRLSLNKTMLDDAFRTDPDSVGTIFGFDSNGDGIRDDGGLSNTMVMNFLDSVTSKYSGDIGRKNKLIDFRITKLNNDYKKYQKVITTKSERLYAEYNRFAEAVNQMSAQFSTFQAQMAQLNQLTSSLYGSSSASQF